MIDGSPSDRHNSAVVPLLRIILDHTVEESEQWVLLESLCFGVGLLHGRNPRETAIYVEAIAERLATGERG